MLNNLPQKQQQAIKKYFKIILIIGINLGLICYFLPFGNNLNLKKSPNNYKVLNNKPLNSNFHYPRIYNLPLQNEMFTGRKKELKLIAKKFSQKTRDILIQPIVGLSGIGKTELAIEFAHQAIANNSYHAVIFLNNESSATLINDYLNIANNLALKIDGLSFNEIQYAVHNKLCTLFKGGKLLIILDDTFSFYQIKDYFMKLHNIFNGNCNLHLLITSNNQHWKEPSLLLQSFTKKEAVAFIKNNLLTEKTYDIEKLTNTFNNHPLALSLAISYIREHTNIADYLSSLPSNTIKFLNITPEESSYRKTLWQTINFSLTKLSANSKEILTIASLLSSKNIKIKFFTQLTIEETMNSIAELKRYSLIFLNKQKNSFTVHPLLQKIIIAKIKETKQFNKWLEQAISLLKNHFDFNYYLPQNWQLWNQALPHAIRLSTHIFANNIDNIEAIEHSCKTAMFMNYINWSATAIDTWEQIEQLIQNKYTTHAPELIALINYNKGNVFHKLGNFNKSKYYLNKAIATLPTHYNKTKKLTKIANFFRLKQVHNLPSHEQRNIDLAVILTQLGQTEFDLGNFHDSVLNLKKSLKILEKIAHPIAKTHEVSALYKLSYTYIFMGKLASAEKILKNLEQANIEQSYIKEHLARLQYMTGEFNNAETILQNLITGKYSPIYPKNHVRFAHILSNLIRIDLAQNNHQRAKTNINYIKNIYNNYYATGSTIYIFVTIDLWKLSEYYEEHAKALAYANTVLLKAKQLYQDNIHEVMGNQLTKAELFTKIQPLASPDSQYYQELITILQELFGKQHYQVARYQYLLAKSYKKAKLFAKAKLHYQKSLAILKNQQMSHPNLQKINEINIKTIVNELQNLNLF